MSTAPLGILSLSAVLRANDFSVKAVDAVLDRRWQDRVLDELQEWKPDVLGFSALTVDLPRTAELVREARQRGYGGLVVGGGVGPTFADNRVRAEAGFDAVVVGEGEHTFLEWLQALRSGADPQQIPGLALRTSGCYRLTAPRALISDLDTLPFPDQTVLPPEQYFGRPSMDLVFRHPRWMSIMTSRSCPMRCTYCAHAMGHGYRTRSLDNVMEEIGLMVSRHRIGELQIIDDLFNLNRDRTREFCERMIRAGHRLALVFPNGLRMDMLDNEIIDCLVRAGLDRMLAPIETTSPRLQAMTKKNLDLAKAKQAIRHLRRRGVLLRISVMYGFPTETAAEIGRSVHDAFRWGGHWLSFNRVVPLPGSEMAHHFVGRSIDWSQFNYTRTNINLSPVSTMRLRIFCLRARLALLRPLRLAAILKRTPMSSLLSVLRSAINRSSPTYS